MRNILQIRLLMVTMLSVMVFFVQAQGVISTKELTKKGYKYDESIHTDWLEKNQINKSDSLLDIMRDNFYSIAKQLKLGIDDEIIVYIDVAKVTKDNLIGLYRLNGDVLFEPKYDYISNIYRTKLWYIKINDKYGLISPASKDTFLIQPKYDELRLTTIDPAGINYLNRFKVKYNDMYGVIDSLGKEITPIEYSELDDRHDKLYLAKKHGKYGFIKPTGEIVIPFMYNKCYHFWDNDLAPVKIGKKWGLINKKNVLVVEPIYDDMFSFQNEILRVRLNGKTGFLNKQGDIFIDLKYDDADAYFKNGVLRVKLDEKYAILNKKGKEICDFKYDGMGKFRNSCTQVRIGEKIGVLNNKGKEILPIEYDKIDIKHNLIIAYNGENKIYFNFRGKEIKY